MIPTYFIPRANVLWGGGGGGVLWFGCRYAASADTS